MKENQNWAVVEYYRHRCYECMEDIKIYFVHLAIFLLSYFALLALCSDWYPVGYDFVKLFIGGMVVVVSVLLVGLIIFDLLDFAFYKSKLKTEVKEYEK